MKEIIVRDEAEKDILKSYEWYEKKRKGLDANFILCVDEAMSRISRNPQHYPSVLNPVRRVFIKRFPCSVYYIEKTAEIIVFAVLHVRQSSRKWKERT